MLKVKRRSDWMAIGLFLTSIEPWRGLS
jgi:hypothetical protein